MSSCGFSVVIVTFVKVKSGRKLKAAIFVIKSFSANQIQGYGYRLDELCSLFTSNYVSSFCIIF